MCGKLFEDRSKPVLMQQPFPEFDERRVVNVGIGHACDIAVAEAGYLFEEQPFKHPDFIIAFSTFHLWPQEPGKDIHY